MRTLRLKLVWLLVLPFLWFASPTPNWMFLGASVGIAGLLLRAWAAGTIRKEQELTTTGPYAYTRNPLYIGSLLTGVGLILGGGQPLWVLLFLAFYLTVYTRTMLGETELLTDLFGEAYVHYAANVPAFLPRLSPYEAPVTEQVSDAGRVPDIQQAGFTFSQYRRNNEWEALLGFVLVFGYFAVRWWLSAR
jgi:protein-S-isoprenylcysteine O-methyltransferase Ste14